MLGLKSRALCGEEKRKPVSRQCPFALRLADEKTTAAGCKPKSSFLKVVVSMKESKKACLPFVKFVIICKIKSRSLSIIPSRLFRDSRRRGSMLANVERSAPGPVCRGKGKGLALAQTTFYFYYIDIIYRCRAAVLEYSPKFLVG